MEIVRTRDHAMYAAIFGFFAISWFGWAQANPPESWRLSLGLASALCFLIACAGVYLAFTHWGDASALSRRGIYKRFGIIVGVELVSASVGALILYLLHKPEFVSAWIAFVVGAHFLPLVSIFQDEALGILAVLTMTASLASVFLAQEIGISVSTVVGVGTGISLLLFAIRGLILVMVWDQPPPISR
jgi:hypothetical protein